MSRMKKAVARAQTAVRIFPHRCAFKGDVFGTIRSWNVEHVLVHRIIFNVFVLCIRKLPLWRGGFTYFQSSELTFVCDVVSGESLVGGLLSPHHPDTSGEPREHNLIYSRSSHSSVSLHGRFSPCTYEDDWTHTANIRYRYYEMFEWTSISLLKMKSMLLLLYQNKNTLGRVSLVPRCISLSRSMGVWTRGDFIFNIVMLSPIDVFCKWWSCINCEQ